mgnify:CR=1 FL=1
MTVYNRSVAKALAWCGEFKGMSAATPREAAANADIVFCCVGNDDDLRSVTLGANGAFAGMKPGATFVDHTTASATVAVRPSLCAPGEWVGWTRYPRDGETVSRVASHVATAGFAGRALVVSDHNQIAVGAGQLERDPPAFEPGVRLFEFIQ